MNKDKRPTAPKTIFQMGILFSTKHLSSDMTPITICDTKINESKAINAIEAINAKPTF
jgi:hypothetical protein